MTHTIAGKSRLLARVRRLRGQIEAVERALEAEAECGQVLHRLAAARGALGGLMAEIVEEHVRSHLVDPVAHPGALDEAAADELLAVVRSYMK